MQSHKKSHKNDAESQIRKTGRIIVAQVENRNGCTLENSRFQLSRKDPTTKKEAGSDEGRAATSTENVKETSKHESDDKQTPKTRVNIISVRLLPRRKRFNYETRQLACALSQNSMFHLRFRNNYFLLEIARAHLMRRRSSSIMLRVPEILLIKTKNTHWHDKLNDKRRVFELSAPK